MQQIRILLTLIKATNKDFVNSHTTVLLLTLPYRMTADDLMGVISQRMIWWSDEQMTTVTLLSSIFLKPGVCFSTDERIFGWLALNLDWVGGWPDGCVFLFSIFQAPNVACGVGFSNTCNTLMQHRGLSLYFSWYYYISSIIWYSHAQKPPTNTTGSAVAWTMHFSIILTPQNVTF